MRSARRPRPPADRARDEPPSTTGATKSRISSTSPASRNAPARCGPPSSRIAVMPAAPSCAKRVAHAVGLVGAGRDHDVGAGDLQRVDRGARRGAGHDHRQRHFGGPAHELRVQRQPRLGVEDDPPRLARHALDPRRQLRIVGQRGADPDDDGVDLGAPVVRQPARVLARDPLGVPGAGRDLAVERHRRLEQHERPPRARVLAERLVQEPRAGRQLALGDVDLDALVAQDPEAAAGGLFGRVVGGDHDAREAGLEDRVRARRRAARCGSTARARRRASRRAGRRRRRPRSPRARRAARPARCGSPRRAPGRRARSPRRPAGWGWSARDRPRRARSPGRGARASVA